MLALNITLTELIKTHYKLIINKKMIYMLYNINKQYICNHKQRLKRRPVCQICSGRVRWIKKFIR
jgi:hypothetical protein